MAKRVLSIVLCFVMVAGVMCADAFAIAPQPAPSREVHNVQQLIARLGSGPDALLAVRVHDKSAASGYVAQIGREGFVIADPNTREQTTVRYIEVERLQGYNLANGVEVHHGVGVRANLARAAMRIVSPVRPAPVNNLTKRNTLIVGIIVGILLAIILGKIL